MKFTLIDLSQEIYQGMPVYPLHQKTMIFQNVSHEETEKSIGFTFATNNLLINEHGPTHSDAIYEYDPQGATIDKMNLDYFYGSAICLDVSHLTPEEWITKEVLIQALQKSDLTIHRGDILLLYTGHYDKYYGSERWLTTYTGLTEEGARWLAEEGVINIGVDAPSIDHTEDSHFSGHKICREYKITNTENLCNLNKVAGTRFLYFGLPLKIRNGTGSPVRAVALLPREEDV